MHWQADRKPVMYRVMYALIKFALTIFFQKIDIRHSYNMPAGKPVVLVANHPNSIMDVLVLGVVTNRKVNYIAHAGLFRNRIFGWILRSCGVIPVYRRQDDPDKMEQNVKMFEACTEALERNEVIGIFPEGISDIQQKVKQLKTGAARIILETEQKHEYNLGVALLPVGLHFYSLSHFRSRVLVNFGEPLDLAPYLATHRKDEHDGVRELTDAIQKALENLIVHIRSESLESFVREIVAIYKDELKTIEPISRKDREKAYREEFVISKAVAECVAFYQNHQPERVEELQDKLALYNRKLNRLNLRDAMLKASLTQKEIWFGVAKAYTQAALGFLPAVYGVLNNFLPYRIAENCGKRFLDERTKILSALLIGGGVAFVLFYFLQSALVYHLWGIKWALLYFLSLPATGFFALMYVTKIREQNQKISFSFYLFTNKHLFNRMKRERRQLITFLDGLREEYLAFQNTSSTTQVI